MRASTTGSTLLLTAVAAISTGGCAGGGMASRPLVMQQENFESTTSHTRNFAASPAQTCEAARRALLSQGYVISAAGSEGVNGRKHFQPDADNHVEVEFRIVCAPEGERRSSTIAFVSALQDRYALKKTNNSASLGVGAIGSVSLPFSSSDDALVKVASETLSGGPFYDRFFRLVERYLPAVAALDPAPAVLPATAPPPPPPPAAPPTSVTPAAAAGAATGAAGGSIPASTPGSATPPPTPPAPPAPPASPASAG